MILIYRAEDYKHSPSVQFEASLKGLKLKHKFVIFPITTVAMAGAVIEACGLKCCLGTGESLSSLPAGNVSCASIVSCSFPESLEVGSKVSHNDEGNCQFRGSAWKDQVQSEFGPPTELLYLVPSGLLPY
jgi:hypothetical protein